MTDDVIVFHYGPVCIFISSFFPFAATVSVRQRGQALLPPPTVWCIILSATGLPTSARRLSAYPYPICPYPVAVCQGGDVPLPRCPAFCLYPRCRRAGVAIRGE